MKSSLEREEGKKPELRQKYSGYEEGEIKGFGNYYMSRKKEIWLSKLPDFLDVFSFGES